MKKKNLNKTKIIPREVIEMWPSKRKKHKWYRLDNPLFFVVVIVPNIYKILSQKRQCNHKDVYTEIRDG